MTTRKTAKKSPPKTPRVLHVLEVMGGIHGIAPPRIEPFTAIASWQVYVVCDGTGRRTRHVVGWANWEGRVSSAIQHWDWKQRTAKTSSGRMYRLVGESGFNRDAEYVFSRWMAINRCKPLKESSAAVERLFVRLAGPQQDPQRNGEAEATPIRKEPHHD